MPKIIKMSMAQKIMNFEIKEMSMKIWDNNLTYFLWKWSERCDDDWNGAMLNKWWIWNDFERNEYE